MQLIKNMRSRVNGMREIWAFDNRWEVMLHRLLFRDTGMVTYRMGDLEFVVDHAGGDAMGTRACLVTDMYRALLHHLDLRGRPLHVLDLGANGGGFPLLLLSEGFSIAKLTAVEMNPRTFCRLQLNVTQNLDAQTTLIHGAVCGEAQTFSLQLGRGSTGESMFASHGEESAMRTVQVEGLTLDEIIARGFGDEPVDLCKMDVEGAEYDVFAGEHAQALRRVRYLIIEIHNRPGFSPQLAHKALAELGFRQILSEYQSESDVYCFENSAR